MWVELSGVLCNPNFSPLMAKNLQGLPDTYILTTQHDILRDDGILYAHWLRQAGVNVTYRHSKHGVHGMFNAKEGKQSVLEELSVYYNDIVKYLVTILRHRPKRNTI